MIQQKLKKTLSKSIHVIFYLFLIGYFLGIIGQFFNALPTKHSILFEFIELKLKISVLLFVLCLCCIFLNKKLLMLMWVITLILIGRFYDNFSLYRNYLEFETCLDFGNVWDYKEHRCRTDCLTWNAEQGCVPLTKENKQEMKYKE